MKLRLLSVSPASASSSKKYTAVFIRDGREFSVSFGARGYDDYTTHRDKKRREAYRARHASGRDAPPETPNALAYWLLWGPSTSLSRNVASFRKRYGV